MDLDQFKLIYEGERNNNYPPSFYKEWAEELSNQNDALDEIIDFLDDNAYFDKYLNDTKKVIDYHEDKELTDDSYYKYAKKSQSVVKRLIFDLITQQRKFQHQHHEFCKKEAQTSAFCLELAEKNLKLQDKLKTK